MEEESEAFTIMLAWEDGDGDPIDLGHWKVTFHAVRRDLKRGDFVVSLARRTVLGLLEYSFGYEVGTSCVVSGTLHIHSHTAQVGYLVESVDLPGRVSTGTSARSNIQ